MKKLITLFLLLTAFLSNSFGQISYTSADYASAGDSILVTKAIIDSIGAANFETTGANSNWNYTNLQPLTQFHDKFLAANSTGYKLSFVTSCIAGGGGAIACNNKWSALVNLGHLEPDSIQIGSFKFSNEVEHYFKSTNFLPTNVLGLTFSLNGLNFPLAISYTIPDTVYRFPLTYGKGDSCTSKYEINLTSVGVNFIYKVKTKRVNHVDGWGKLITPYKTFASTDKLRTELYSTDTLIFNGDTIAIPTTKQEVYSWFDAGSKIPVLKVTGNAVNSNVVYTEIEYTDTIRCLDPLASFSKTPSVIYLNTSKTALVNFNNSSNNADIYSWNFGDPANGGSNTSTLSSPSHIYTANGTYKVQLIAGNNLCSPIRYDTIVIPVIVIDSTLAEANFTYSPLQPCTGDTVHFTNTSLNASTYAWDFGDKTNSALKSPKHSYTLAGSYTVSLIAKNNTQADTIEMQIVVSTTPVAVIAPTGTINLCSGDSIVLHASGGTFYQWNNGKITDSIIVKTTGKYSVKVFNSCGNSTSQTDTVNFVSFIVPTVSVSASQTTVCDSSGVTFMATETGGGSSPAYQWKLNNQVEGTDSVNYSTAALKDGDVVSCTLTSSAACANPQSVTGAGISVKVNPLPAQPSILQMGDTISSTIIAAGYQWFYDRQLIGTTTINKFGVGQDGQYQVEITDTNGCKSVSNDFDVIGTLAGSLQNTGEVYIYPNPTAGSFNLKADFDKTTSTDVFITNLLGTTIMQIEGGNLIDKYNKQVDISNLSPSVYFLKVESKSMNLCRRVVKL